LGIYGEFDFSGSAAGWRLFVERHKMRRPEGRAWKLAVNRNARRSIQNLLVGWIASGRQNAEDRAVIGLSTDDAQAPFTEHSLRTLLGNPVHLAEELALVVHMYAAGADVAGDTELIDFESD
jgi:hypothetical protein